ncbi:MAG TPA: dTMP kinase [Steroidobacteraceae bacterium]|nr:dTMP kinase [Steroidobacteraceae bacterium]
MTAAARFVTFEGIEGVGKSTQLRLLAAALGARGIDALLTREPGGTPLGEKMRALLLEPGGGPLPPAAELLLIFAARAVHLQERIEPALRAGRWVLCDRFTDATYAYQGAGRRLPAEAIGMLEQWVQGLRRPHLTILLDMPVAAALERVRGRGGAADRFEGEQREFFERVRQAYLARAAAEPRRIVVIDAARAADAVGRSVFGAIEAESWIS